MPTPSPPHDRSHAGPLTVNRGSTANLRRRGSGACRPPTRPRGFSLVEVLVAVLVLTVGLLGLAALQVTGLKAIESSHLRTLATFAVYDAVERLRADPIALRKSDGTCTIPAGACSNIASETLARQRWYRTFCSLGLPTPAEDGHPNALSVTCPGTTCGAGNCEITVSFSDTRVGAGDTTFQVCTRLPSSQCLAPPQP